MRARGIASVAVIVVVGAAALPAQAIATEEISQTRPADPVLAGSTVEYSMTVTNTSGAPEELWLGVLLTKAGSDGPVENEFAAVTTTAGSCSVDPVDRFGYRSLTCNLGILAAGQTVTVRDSVRVDFSQEHGAATFDCNPEFNACFPGPSSVVRTLTIRPPELTGSNKLTYIGLPEGCASADFALKAKARGAGVRNVSATLSGPRNEYGVFDAEELFSRKAKRDGRKLKLNVPASSMEPGYYKFTLLALRGGAPKLKGIATFQVCYR